MFHLPYFVLHSSLKFFSRAFAALSERLTNRGQFHHRHFVQIVDWLTGEPLDDGDATFPHCGPTCRELSISTGQPLTSKITLTPEQRQAAHYSMPNLPKDQAEKVYAQNLLRMQSMKAQGLLQNGDGR
jgi:hypothetical protein